MFDFLDKRIAIIALIILLAASIAAYFIPAMKFVVSVACAVAVGYVAYSWYQSTSAKVLQNNMVPRF
jgi:hypothetical protein